MANKFFAKKVWIVPGNEHRFRSEHDAKYYCEQNGIDFSTVEKYDSIKEYERWLELQELERQGRISELKRQVEFELTPKQYRREKVREKMVKGYYAYHSTNPFIDAANVESVMENHFTKKKDAVAYAKAHNIPTKNIATYTFPVPVYKDVTILDRSVYTADFTYIEDGEFIIEDCKSDYTKKEADYVLRKKFLYYKYRILIRET